MNDGTFQKGLYGSLDNYTGIDEKYSGEFSVTTIRKYTSKLKDGKKILDVGCADGDLLSALVSRHKLYGVDISTSLVKRAAKKGLMAQVVDLEKGLPFKNKFFDVIVVHHVLEHVVNTDKLLSDINRVLKIRGTLFLTFPNSTSLVSAFMYLLDYPPYCGARYRSLHVRDFTLKTVKIALFNNGFEVQEVFGGSFLILKNNFLSLVTKYLPRLAADITLRAKKVKNVHRLSNQVYDFGLNRKRFLRD